ncbi:hypothetical protein FB451DRAFT_1365191 [Mycena latifolia]|nr:hypothetical protein FB451DRAFT_1365191 [Mycena latifolia]
MSSIDFNHLSSCAPRTTRNAQDLRARGGGVEIISTIDAQSPSARGKMRIVQRPASAARPRVERNPCQHTAEAQSSDIGPPFHGWAVDIAAAVARAVGARGRIAAHLLAIDERQGAGETCGPTRTRKAAGVVDVDPEAPADTERTVQGAQRRRRRAQDAGRAVDDAWGAVTEGGRPGAPCPHGAPPALRGQIAFRASAALHTSRASRSASPLALRGSQRLASRCAVAHLLRHGAYRAPSGVSCASAMLAPPHPSTKKQGERGQRRLDPATNGKHCGNLGMGGPTVIEPVLSQAGLWINRPLQSFRRNLKREAQLQRRWLNFEWDLAVEAFAARGFGEAMVRPVLRRAERETVEG